MTTRPVRIVASLLACSAGLVAVDNATYSYDELAAGRDIHDDIYSKHGGGEFDEWRIHLGYAPAIDRAQLKSTVKGQAYPGNGYAETDKVVSSPALSPQIGLEWVLGDYEGGDYGWFATLGLEYTRRNYRILYGLGTASVPLRMDVVTAKIGMGYGWYLNDSLRYEFEPFVDAGMMWTELDLIDLSLPAPTVRVSGGPTIEGGLRNALIWHPGRTQSWHLGVTLDYRAGYAQTIFHTSGPDGDVDSEVRFWWYGFCSSVLVGAKF